MSRFTTLKAILEGFKNYNFPSEEVERVAKERAVICSQCEYANPDHPFSKMLDDQSTVEIKGLGCNVCGCLLSAKVRQFLQDCPEGKWKKNLSTNN